MVLVSDTISADALLQVIVSVNWHSPLMKVFPAAAEVTVILSSVKVTPFSVLGVVVFSKVGLPIFMSY